jgi:DNA-binding LytR/AlgR family response regulator
VTEAQNPNASFATAQFAQVHRSTVVNLVVISRVVRGENETATIHLEGRIEVLPVSRSLMHLFRQMQAGPPASVRWPAAGPCSA